MTLLGLLSGLKNTLIEFNQDIVSNFFSVIYSLQCNINQFFMVFGNWDYLLLAIGIVHNDETHKLIGTKPVKYRYFLSIQVLLMPILLSRYFTHIDKNVLVSNEWYRITYLPPYGYNFKRTHIVVSNIFFLK